MIVKSVKSGNRIIFKDDLIVPADLNPSEDFDINVKISTNDTTTGYLNSKIDPGYGIDADIINASSNEQLQLSLNRTDVLAAGFWKYELKSSVALRTIATAFDATSDYLDYSSGNGLYNVEYIEDTGLSNGSLGGLRSIGSSSSMSSDDWSKLDGALFLYIAQDKNYFNIIDNTSDTIGGNQKKIYTRAGFNLDMIQRALFAYNNTLGAWVVLSYTPAKWIKRYSITASDSPNTDVFVMELPISGYYKFDYSIYFQQLDGSLNPVNSAVAEVMTLKTSVETIGDSTQSVFIPAPGGLEKLVNINMVGSGIIFCNDTSCVNRYLKYNLTLPNGTTQQIDDGFIHVQYITKHLGSDCY